MNNKQVVHLNYGTYNLSAHHSGIVYILDNDRGIRIRLPKLKIEDGGWHCEFIVKKPPGNSQIYGIIAKYPYNIQMDNLDLSSVRLEDTVQSGARCTFLFDGNKFFYHGPRIGYTKWYPAKPSVFNSNDVPLDLAKTDNSTINEVHNEALGGIKDTVDVIVEGELYKT